MVLLFIIIYIAGDVASVNPSHHLDSRYMYIIYIYVMYVYTYIYILCVCLCVFDWCLNNPAKTIVEIEASHNRDD